MVDGAPPRARRQKFLGRPVCPWALPSQLAQAGGCRRAEAGGGDVEVALLFCEGPGRRRFWLCGP